MTMAESSSKRPWWGVAFATGLGIGAGVVAALGLGASQARGVEPKVATTSVVSLPPGAVSLDDRLRGIETSLKTLSDDMVEVKQRLPPKKP